MTIVYMTLTGIKPWLQEVIERCPAPIKQNSADELLSDAISVHFVYCVRFCLCTFSESFIEMYNLNEND